jgi:FkbM family methyltransferase
LKIVRKSSLEAADDFQNLGVDAVFIDGSHLEEDVRADIRAWAPKARKLICGHDYSKGFPGVCAAVDAELGEVRHLESIWWKERGEPMKLVPAKLLANPEIAHRGQQDQFVVDEVVTQDCYRLEKLAKLIDAPKVVVDVGGHIGTFGIKARSLWPGARIIAFEPNRESAELYRKNVPDAEVSEAAVSYEPEKTVLAEHVWVATGGGILTRRENIGLLPGCRAISEENVQSVTLEDLNLADGDRIDLLKLDCEGSEFEILRQMRPETAARIDLVVGEYHMNMVAGNLGYSGFEKRVKEKFPNFDVVPLNRPGTIGTFAAGPPKIVAGLARGAGPQSPFKTPLGNLVFLTFTRGPRVSVKGAAQVKYGVSFINEETGECVYGTTIGADHWAEPSPKYFMRWRVLVDEDGRRVVDEPLWLDGKKVLIVLSSKSLGDTVAWAPYADEFRKVHRCEVHVATFWREILEDAYPDVVFHDQGVRLDDFYAVYEVGCFDGNYNKNPNHWQAIPLQQIATDCLGLPWEEIRPKVSSCRKVAAK